MKKNKIELHEQVVSQEVIYCYEVNREGIEHNDRIRLQRYRDDEDEWMAWTLQETDIDKIQEYLDEDYARALVLAFEEANKL